MVHSDGLSEHGILLMWKITEIRKMCPFFFSQKFCITPFINFFLVQNVTVGSLVYSQPNFVFFGLKQNTVHFKTGSAKFCVSLFF